MGRLIRPKVPVEFEQLHRRLGGYPELIGPGRHSIKRGQIHRGVFQIVDRLNKSGHLTLIVGGAVRDMLLGKIPKDFDIVTTARPKQVTAAFRNSRMIGRRFRLVLVNQGGIEVEVSTFRKQPKKQAQGQMIKRQNSFGSPEDDALRRDFTINAMAFDPGQFVLIDFVGGLKDLNRQVIRSIVSPSRSFTEDPVRMLRAVRFKERLDWELNRSDEKAIQKCSGNLVEVVRHRLAEETQRFLTSGQAEKTFREFDRLGLLPALLGLKPYSKYLKKGALDNPLPLLEPYLKSLDEWSLKRNEKVLSVVALLGLLTTLFDDEMTDYLRFNPLNQTGRFRCGDRIEKEFDAFFGEWGFLDTHVKPALTILYAFRKLFQRLSNRADSGPVQKIPSGTREAWMLVVLMKPVYGLSSRQVHEAFNKISKLPKLFISDRRLKPGPRSAAPPRRRGENSGDASEQNSGQATGSRRRPLNRRDADSADQNPEESRSSQRRSRNRRPRNRRRSPSTKVSVES